MTKTRCPVSLHGVVARAFDQVGGLDDVLTILPHRKKGWLYAAMNPDLEAHQQAKLTQEDLRALVRAGAVAIAEDFARLANMQLVPVGKSESPAATLDLMAKFSGLMAETGEAVQVGAAAIADGRLTRNEIINMRKQLLDVLTAANGLLGDLNAEDGGG